MFSVTEVTVLTNFPVNSWRNKTNALKLGGFPPLTKPNEGLFHEIKCRNVFFLTRLKRRDFPESHKPTSNTAFLLFLVPKKNLKNTAMYIHDRLFRAKSFKRVVFHSNKSHTAAKI